MGTHDRVETSRTLCECGRGQFAFYSCEAERGLYVDNPIEKWFEMHIFCKTCADKFQRYKPIVFSLDEEPDHWKIIIPYSDRVPIH